MTANHLQQTVLIIDDDPACLNLLREGLATVHRLIFAVTGLEGLKTALLEEPDLILLDILMPGMDGYRVCARLKENPKTKHIPVILMSGDGDDEDEARGLELGAIDFINKPFNRSIVAARVRNHLSWKRHQDQLQQFRDTAERAVRAKSLFMANMSHEIRGPMNAIIGMTDLVLRSELTSEQQRFLEIVLQSSESLLSLLNSILDLSKIEAGKLELESLLFDPLDVVEKACETMALRARNENLDLLHDVSFNVPPRLIGDPIQFRQIIINLLGNAIKFTRQGEVVVRVCLESEYQARTAVPVENGEGDRVMLHVSVSDTGIGIAKEKLALIFKSFKQAEISTARKFGGTGLGLAISRQLTRLMGGEMYVESEVGVGSTFHFTAGFRRPTASEINAQPDRDEWPDGCAADFSDRRILLAEGNQTARAILGGILTRCHARVSKVSAGAELLEELTRADRAGTPFDVILLDCALANVGKINLPERLLTLSGGLNRIVTLLPPGSRLQDIPWCKKLQRVGGLIKPVKRSDLIVTIRGAMAGKVKSKNRPATPHAPDEKRRVRPLNILLTEDDEDSRLLTTQILKRVGHSVRSAINGREALSILEEERFDLILMDVQMPEMNGIQATRSIRKGLVAAVDVEIPILGVSARAMVEDRRECLAAGMTDFLAKPFRKNDLLNKVAQFGPAGTGNEPLPTDNDGEPALAPVQGDGGWDGFHDKARVLLGELEKALHQGETELAEAKAQWLKEEARSIGAEEVRRFAFQVVMAARTGDAGRSMMYLNRLKRLLNGAADNPLATA